MANINLLPEDLRRRETKEAERLAKQPKIMEIELSEPSKEKAEKVMIEKPKKSLWSRMVGKLETPKAPDAGVPQVFANQSIDILSSAKKQGVSYGGLSLGGGRSVNQEEGWAGVFGKPYSPIKPASVSNAFVGQAPQPVKQEIKIKEIRSHRSWWQAIKQMFSGSKKGTAVARPPKVLLSQIEMPPIKPSVEAKPMAEETIKEQLPPLKPKLSWWSRLKQKFIHKQKAMPPLPVTPQVEEKAQGRYHQAPKIEKSSLDINLIPEELFAIKEPSNFGRILAVVVAIILPTLAIYGCYLLINEGQRRAEASLATVQGEFSLVKNQSRQFEEQYQASLDFQKRMIVFKDVFSKHIRWTNFFNSLEKYTLDDVFYTSLTADVSGEFVLPAVANDYNTVARQVAVLKGAKDFVKEVRVDDIRLRYNEKSGIDGVAFKIKVVLADDLLIKP